jgi:WD40 repeat protein
MIRDFDMPVPPRFPWFNVAFLPDGKRFLTTTIAKGGFSPTALALWDADTGTLLQTYKGHTDCLMAVAVSPDGKVGFSGGMDQMVRAWKLPAAP